MPSEDAAVARALNPPVPVEALTPNGLAPAGVMAGGGADVGAVQRQHMPNIVVYDSDEEFYDARNEFNQTQCSSLLTVFGRYALWLCVGAPPQPTRDRKQLSEHGAPIAADSPLPTVGSSPAAQDTPVTPAPPEKRLGTGSGAAPGSPFSSARRHLTSESVLSVYFSDDGENFTDAEEDTPRTWHSVSRTSSTSGLHLDSLPERLLPERLFPAEAESPGEGAAEGGEGKAMAGALEAVQADVGQQMKSEPGPQGEDVVVGDGGKGISGEHGLQENSPSGASGKLTRLWSKKGGGEPTVAAAVSTVGFRRSSTSGQTTDSAGRVLSSRRGYGESQLDEEDMGEDAVSRRHEARAFEQAWMELEAEGYTIGFSKFEPPDETLHRFLRARGFEVPRALEMYRNAVAWRREFGVEELHNFEYPEEAAVKGAYPQFHHGVDKLGRPIYFELLGSLDIERLAEVTTTERLLKYHVREWEKLVDVKFPACSRKAGRYVGQTLTILDVKGVKMSMMKKNVRDMIKEVMSVDQDFYPEYLGTMVIINAPMVFKAIFQIVKAWVDKKTLAKIEMLGTRYQQRLLELVDATELPAVFGGQCQCGSGGCTSSNKGPWLDPAFNQGPLPWEMPSSSKDRS